MDEVHVKVLRKNRPYLVKEIILDEFWDHLESHEIFSNQMIENIKAAGSRSSQLSRLLSDLTRRGPNAYPQFMECLIDTEQQHIVDRLNKTEQELRLREPKYITPDMNSTPINLLSANSSISSKNSAPIRELNSPIANHIPSTNSAPLPTDHITSQMRHPFSFVNGHHPTDASSTTVSTTHQTYNNGHELHSPTTTSCTETVSLMDYQTTTTSSSTNNTVTNTRPSLSFSHAAAPSAGRHASNEEVTPGKRPMSFGNKDMVRRNLGAILRSPVNQTDNGNGVTVGCVQTTDHPQAIEVNAYPQLLGIPCTQGRMDIRVESQKTDSNTITPNWDTMYKMTSDPRGYCLIINNRYFTGHLKERLGTDVDRDNLYMLYSQLGYNICIQENLTGMDMLLMLRDFAQLPEHRYLDSCVVVLLTHGLDGQVYGTDAKLINLSEVFTFFDGDVCLGLKGKPKFFLIQACRGEKYDAGFDMPDNGKTDMAGQAILDMQKQEMSDIDQLSRRLPSGSDFLIAYATVPGFVSWRNSEQGSWFVQALCEIFSRKCRHEDALNMLVEVNNKVATIYESATKHKQMPSPVVLLRKKLYFFPLVSV